MASLAFRTLDEEIWPVFNNTLEAIGKCLLFLGDCDYHWDYGTILFEQFIISTHKDELEHSSTCASGCTKSNIFGFRYVCTVCAVSDLCDACYKEYQTCSLQLPVCQEHDFLQVPQDEWEEMEPGAVDVDGRTFEEWLEYLVQELSQQKSTPSPGRVQEEEEWEEEEERGRGEEG